MANNNYSLKLVELSNGSRNQAYLFGASKKKAPLLTEPYFKHSLLFWD